MFAFANSNISKYFFENISEINLKIVEIFLFKFYIFGA